MRLRALSAAHARTFSGVVSQFATFYLCDRSIGRRKAAGISQAIALALRGPPSSGAGRYSASDDGRDRRYTPHGEGGRERTAFLGRLLASPGSNRWEIHSSILVSRCLFVRLDSSRLPRSLDPKIEIAPSRKRTAWRGQGPAAGGRPRTRLSALGGGRSDDD